MIVVSFILLYVWPIIYSSLVTFGETIAKMDRLNELFENKTVVIVAHRLSTVKNADNIIVMNKERDGTSIYR